MAKLTDKEIIAKLMKSRQKAIEEASNFFEEEYPTFSQEDKAAFWASEFRQQMRWNGESGVNEMYVFGKEEYRFCKEKDPNFDILLPMIAKHLKFSLEYLKKAFEKE